MSRVAEKEREIDKTTRTRRGGVTDVRSGWRGWFRSGCARPGNALDAASSQGMSHRRYGKPVRLGYKAPSLSLSICLFLPVRLSARSLSAGVFSATLPSVPSSSRPSVRPFVPLALPTPCLTSITAGTFLPVLSLSLSSSIHLPTALFLLPRRDLAGPTVVLSIFNRHFVAPRIS